MNGNYRPDHAGTGALMRSGEVADFVRNIAEDAKRFAETIAPRESGEYAGSFRLEAGVENVARERRAVVRLINDAEHAAVVESKTHVLSRTRDHVEGGRG